MNHFEQDWEPVAFRKKNPGPHKTDKPIPGQTESIKKVYSGNNKQQPGVNAKKIEQIDEEEGYVPPKVTSSLQMQIQQARQAKKWTQKQLANACSLPESTVKSYENGSCVPKQVEINKMSRALGLQLKK